MWPLWKKALIKCNECDTKSMFHPLAFLSMVFPGGQNSNAVMKLYKESVQIRNSDERARLDELLRSPSGSASSGR